jgi:hypothetical protein
MDENITEQLELLSQLKDGYSREYDRLTKAPSDADPGQFFLNNQMFGSVDAELMYAMIRHLKPKRILEVGSGFSTALIALAIADNVSEAKGNNKSMKVRFESVDPVAPGFSYKVRGANLIVKRLQDTTVLTELKPGDMLIIDSSHIWTEQGEVKAIFDALPSLQGVYVHFHDIFLPYGYPEQWADRGYDEQDHLKEFLAANPEWKVLLAANRIHQENPDALADAIASYDPSRPIGPGSFWMVAPRKRPIAKKRVG